MSDLHTLLTNLIAEAHGITPEEVTPEFIEEQRNILWHRPDFRFEDGNPYLEHPNLYQIEEEQRRADDFLDKVLRGKER